MIQSDFISESDPGGRVENRLERVWMTAVDHIGGCCSVYWEEGVHGDEGN